MKPARYLLILFLLAAARARAAEHWDFYTPEKVLWSQAAAMVAFEGSLYLSGVHPSGHAQLWRTEDGTSWTTVSFPTNFEITRFVEDSGTLYAASYDVLDSSISIARKILSTTDGTNWVDISNQLGNPGQKWTDFCVFKSHLFLGD